MGTMMIHHWTWGPDSLENDETCLQDSPGGFLGPHLLNKWIQQRNLCSKRSKSRDLKFSIILLIFLCAPEFEKLTLEALHIFLQVVGCWDH
jgi:hypothetical protein